MDLNSCRHGSMIPQADGVYDNVRVAAPAGRQLLQWAAKILLHPNDQVGTVVGRQTSRHGVCVLERLSQQKCHRPNI